MKMTNERGKEKKGKTTQQMKGQTGTCAHSHAAHPLGQHNDGNIAHISDA
jgi:hypothetical protein